MDFIIQVILCTLRIYILHNENPEVVPEHKISTDESIWRVWNFKPFVCLGNFDSDL